MKSIALLTALLVYAALVFTQTGCAHIVVSKAVSVTGTNTTLHVSTLFSNSAFKNLGLDRTKPTSSSLLEMSGVTTAPNPEAITASAEALGALIGVAAKTAAK